MNNNINSVVISHGRDFWICRFFFLINEMEVFSVRIMPDQTRNCTTESRDEERKQYHNTTEVFPKYYILIIAKYPIYRRNISIKHEIFSLHNTKGT